MLAAVAQLCSRSNVAHNLLVCKNVIARASAAGAGLIWLPEASDFIAGPADVPRLSRPLERSEFVDGIKASAKEGRIWVGVGVHETADEKRCYNTNLLISPEGNIVQAYRKLHLFDVNIKGGAVILESSTTVPGKELLPPAKTPLGKIGLLTCYDLRFPEVSLSLRRQGAQILTYPSAFTLRTGAAHWETLLRARAIETQTYVLAPAQIGSHSPTRQSYGHALIVDPWGTVLAQGTDRQPVAVKEGEDGPVDEGTFVTAEVDLSWLESTREGMPLWEQRRGDVYPVL
ncbi:putative NIT2-nitrilase [Leucosporidium creatinivorum]|uniref:Putative NIT2-nitrilase n=1 Tax=Leucosporidium creatinivorum TaxID=106004 RepID=A0A1Y2EV24_9BASI|nr:putative NIT2-nitrilase [Leucosporidium creatinivorum]